MLLMIILVMENPIISFAENSVKSEPKWSSAFGVIAPKGSLFRDFGQFQISRFVKKAKRCRPLHGAELMRSYANNTCHNPAWSLPGIWLI